MNGWVHWYCIESGESSESGELPDCLRSPSIGNTPTDPTATWRAKKLTKICVVSLKVSPTRGLTLHGQALHSVTGGTHNTTTTQHYRVAISRSDRFYLTTICTGETHWLNHMHRPIRFPSVEGIKETLSANWSVRGAQDLLLSSGLRTVREVVNSETLQSMWEIFILSAAQSAPHCNVSLN